MTFKGEHFGNNQIDKNKNLDNKESLSSLENKESSELLNFFDEGDPAFLEKKKSIILGLREKIEKTKTPKYKMNAEDVFINKDVLDLAEEYGHQETMDVLKKEFVYSLKYSKDFEKKVNIAPIVSNYLKSSDSNSLEKHRTAICENFEENIKLAFLTEASTRLLKKYPDLKLINYIDSLQEVFTDFPKINKKVLDSFFAPKSIKVDNENEFRLKQDKIIMTDIDFEKGEIEFESEKYKLLTYELKRIVDDEKSLSMKELEDMVSFLETESKSLSKPGFLAEKKKKIAHEKLENKIIEAKKKFEASLEKLKREEHEIGGYVYHNEFIEIFNSFKSEVDFFEKDLSVEGKLKYRKMVEEFKKSLDDLRNAGSNLHEAGNLKKNINQSSLRLFGKGKLMFPVNFGKLDFFKEFEEIIKLGLLEKPFSKERLELTLDKINNKLKEILSSLDKEDLEKFEYFKSLKKEFSLLCKKRGVLPEIEKEMIAKFF